MTLREIKELLDAEVLIGEDQLDMEVNKAFVADLMSDVLAFSSAGALLLTGLVNIQTVQTAHVAEINAIFFVRGKKPDKNVIAMARKMQIPLLGTPYSMYEACGILYREGIPSTMKCGQNVALAPGT